MHNEDYEEFCRLLAPAMKLCGAETLVTGQPKFGAQ